MRGRGKPGTAPAPILFDLLEEQALPHVKLFALLHDIAPLCAKVDHFCELFDELSIPGYQHQKVRIGLSLLSELYEMEAQLRNWPSTLELTTPLYWDEPSTLYSAYSSFITVSSAYKVAVCFPSVRVAIAMLFCGTGLLFVCMLREMIDMDRTAEGWTASMVTDCGISTDSDAGPSPLEEVPSIDWTPETSHSFAIRIARSLEYFLHPDMGRLGTYLIGFPLGVLQSYYDRRSMTEESLWLKVVNARMTESGSGLGEFLQELKAAGSSMTAVR